MAQPERAVWSLFVKVVGEMAIAVFRCGYKRAEIEEGLKGILDIAEINAKQ